MCSQEERASEQQEDGEEVPGQKGNMSDSTEGTHWSKGRISLTVVWWAKMMEEIVKGKL